MLVLTRRIGEQIIIDEDIRITVVAVQGNKVRIGITAPPDVLVDRQEVSERRLQSPAKGRPAWSRSLSPNNESLLAPVH
jgi:carbon storage regulator